MWVGTLAHAEAMMGIAHDMVGAQKIPGLRTRKSTSRKEGQGVAGDVARNKV